MRYRPSRAFHARCVDAQDAWAAALVFEREQDQPAVAVGRTDALALTDIDRVRHGLLARFLE